MHSKLTMFTSEYQMGPQKLTCQSYSNQPTCPLNMLLLKQLFQILQQPYLWCISVSCGQHISSNTHDTKEIWIRNGYKPDIFSLRHPAEIGPKILLIFKLCCTPKSHNNNEPILRCKQERFITKYGITARPSFTIITYVMIFQERKENK